MGFRPLTLFGYTFSGALALLGVILLIGTQRRRRCRRDRHGLTDANPYFDPYTHTYTHLYPHACAPNPHSTSTITPSPTLSPTPTFTPTPTPILAVIRTDLAEGVRFRLEPAGETIGFLANNAVR